MSIITISRGSYSRGKEIAERLAERLGYACISRDHLFEGVEELDPRDAKLIHSIEDIPSVFSRFRHGKDAYIAYIQSALLNRLKGDKVVYEGFVGHVFLKEIPQILKVRIISDYADRTRIVAERDGVSEEQALKSIKKIDEQRRSWSKYLYGIDPSDANQYDIVLNVAQIPTEAVVDSLARLSGLEQFRMTEESRRKLENLALAAEIRNSLTRTYAGVAVSADQGKVKIQSKIPRSGRAAFISDLEQLARESSAVKEMDVELQIPVPLSRERVAESLIIRP